MPGREFWGLHAVLVAAAGVLLLMCRFAFGKLLAADDATSGQVLRGVEVSGAH